MFDCRTVKVRLLNGCRFPELACFGQRPFGARLETTDRCDTTREIRRNLAISRASEFGANRPESTHCPATAFQGTGSGWAPRRLKTTTPKRARGENDAETDMLLGIPRSAICVQRFDDSLNSAIHTTYRVLLRSSSIHEPRDPPLKVVNDLIIKTSLTNSTVCKFARLKCQGSAAHEGAAVKTAAPRAAHEQAPIGARNSGVPI